MFDDISPYAHIGPEIELCTLVKHEHQAEFRSLGRLLKTASTLHHIFAIENDEIYRGHLIDQISVDFVQEDQRLYLIDLARATDQNLDTGDQLEALLDSYAHNNAIINLVNVDGWLKSKQLEWLNVRRNAMADKFEATIIWWSSAEVVGRVAMHAPDAWSWRSGVLDFSNTDAERLKKTHELYPHLSVGCRVEILRGTEKLPHGAFGKQGRICRIDLSETPFFIDLGHGNFAWACADELRVITHPTVRE